MQNHLIYCSLIIDPVPLLDSGSEKHLLPMIMSDVNDQNAPLKVLVALASYGTSNDEYLRRLIREYQSLPFEVDIVVVSNIEKRCAPGVECIVGLPNKNPWSLPFS